MKSSYAMALLMFCWIFFAAGSTTYAAEAPSAPSGVYAGSKSCRECHERFYGLWSTSLHGLAMQPYSEALAKEKLSAQIDDVIIGK